MIIPVEELFACQNSQKAATDPVEEGCPSCNSSSLYLYNIFKVFFGFLIHK